MIKYYLLVIFSFLLPRIHGQNPELVALANQLTKGLTDDSLKVVAISDWIIDNISYDWDSYNTIPLPEKCVNVNLIIKNKKSVCEGYANLFNELCRLSNIKSAIINGYVYSEPNVNHAWNGVKIHEKWYLMDLTWADNEDLQVAHDKQRRLSKNPIQQPNRYLWAATNVFLVDHLPHDPIWQLMEKKIDYQDFIKPTYVFDESNKEPYFGKEVVAEESFDSIQRIYRSIQRRLKYRSDDAITIQDAGYFFMQRGYEIFLKNLPLLNNPEFTTLPKEMRSSLEQAKKYYLISSSYFEKLQPFEGFKEYGRSNLISIQNNISELDKVLHR